MVIYMEKILTFIIDENDKLLLLQGSDKDPQFHKSLWYVVTGGKEDIDNSLEDTVSREVKEETNLDVEKSLYLNWIFKYDSLGESCVEYAYISKVKNTKIILNEESIDYKWLNIEEFIDQIDWFGNKENLKKVLYKAIEFSTYYNEEVIEV